MKKYFYLLTLLLTSLVVFQGCKPKAVDPIVPPLASRMYAYLDSVLWIAPTYQAIYFPKSNVLMITASNTTGYSLSFYIHTNLQDGTFPMTATSDKNVTTLRHDIGSAHFEYFSYANSNAQGAVVLKGMDVNNKVINGTFDVRLINPSNGSEHRFYGGVFQNIPYTVSNGQLLGLMSDDIFGSAWMPQVSTMNWFTKTFVTDVVDPTSGQNLTLIVPNNLGVGKYPLQTLGNISAIYRPDFNHTQFNAGNADTLYIDQRDPNGSKLIQGRLVMITKDFSGQSPDNSHQVSFNFTY